MLEILRAHGLDAGPTQHPLLAGVAASIVADIPALGLLQAFGSLGALAQVAQASIIIPALAYIGMMLLGGVLYGWLFQRAANDPRGGWLFGMAFGFVLWMVGPIPLLQWLPTQPLLTGYPAVGLLLGELLWGLVLGVAFPYVHRPLRPSSRRLPRARARKPPATRIWRGVVDDRFVLRHCERSEAKQSRAAVATPDCFVAYAPRNDGEPEGGGPAPSSEPTIFLRAKQKPRELPMFGPI